MRERIAEQHRARALWDLKHRRGGLVDIEFIAQYLQLREAAATARRPAAEHRRRRSPRSPRRRCSTPAAARTARAALRLWRDVQRLLKLTARRAVRRGGRGAGARRRCWRAAPARLTSPRSKRIWTRAADARSRAGTSARSRRRRRGRRREPARRRGATHHEHRDRRQGAGFHAADRRRRQGHACRSSSGKKVVLYFYPKDDTSGCTAEACGFRDSASRISRSSTPTVIGVSQGQRRRARQVQEEIRAALHPRLRRGRQGRARTTASGSRRACTAANTWASSARPS